MKKVDRPASLSRVLRLGVVLLIVFFGVAFHLRNAGFVTLDYYLSSISLPLSLWVFIWITVGVGLGLLASLPAILRLKRQVARQRRQLDAMKSGQDGVEPPHAGNTR